MIFFRLILTNLLRHRIRTLIGVAGICFSVAAMLAVVAMLQGAIRMFERILAQDSEFIVFEKNVSDLFFSNVPGNDVKAIGTWSMVEHARPVLFGIVSSEGHPVITCFGVVPDDARIRKATWISGSAEQFTLEASGVVLGERAAKFMEAVPGREVAIGREKFTVLGVIRSENGFEDGGVFMPLAAAQKFFHKQGVSSVATVKLKHKEDKARFKADVEKAFPHLIALENEEFSRTYSQFRILKATAWAVGLCGLILGGLGVANTMIMSVFTRIREIAILRVNGFSSRQVAVLILGESALVSLTGVATGLLLGFGAILGLKSLPMMHGYIEARVDATILISVAALACATGVVGALYPAIYAMRIRAAEALRFE
jgi:putative ABC transport system permease protein